MKLKPKSNFMPIPNDLIKKHMRLMTNSEFVLLIILFHLSHSFSKPDFYHSDISIAKRFGMKKTTLYRARKGLKEKGFIEYRSGYKNGSKARATTYLLLPSEKLRSELRIVSN